MGDPQHPVTTERRDAVLVVSLDDGKANAITHAMIEQLGAALDEAEADGDIRAVAINGRDGRFSAGFDLSVMQAGPNEARELLGAGGQLGLRIYTFPKPVVLGCTGHALAMGSILLMVADARIGAAGPFKIGLNEIAIGMPVPRFAVEVARDRLAKHAFVPSVLHAQVHDPDGARDAGFLDQVLPPEEVPEAAIAHAAHLAATLSLGAFTLTRTFVRGELGEQLATGMARDMALFDLADS